jgi:hypothetical protein
MTVDITAHLADIERQKAEWPLCLQCGGTGKHAATGTDAGPGIGFQPGPCPNGCVNGRIPQPVYIVGEGRQNFIAEGGFSPPAGWPAVGERVKCETCDGAGRIMTGQDYEVDCPACNGEGSTLPRVELTTYDDCYWTWGSALIEVTANDDGSFVAILTDIEQR